MRRDRYGHRLPPRFDAWEFLTWAMLGVCLLALAACGFVIAAMARAS